MSRTLRLFLAGLVAAIVVAAGVWFLAVPRLTSHVTDTFGQGAYRLETTEGQPFTQASLKGAPAAVFFGYTHCPDACPTTLGEIATWQDELGKTGKRLRVFFVTVDPERDTLDALKDYLSWVPGVVGVSGSRAEMDAAISAFHIYARKIPGDNGEYTMDHTVSLFLFDGQGRMVEPIGYGEDEPRAMAKLRKLME